MTFACLGRFGDIANMLPLIYAASTIGPRPRLLVSRDFESILDGVSYVDRIVYPGAYSELPKALRWAGGRTHRIAQIYGHPTQWRMPRKCESYNKESWRVANALPLWNTAPLVFDLRNPEREDELAKSLGWDDRPTILTAFAGTSSPFREAPQLWTELERAVAGTGFRLLDISHLRAARVYDLLGLLDRAACLVTIDTVHLHLARASTCPTVALLNEGWFGSSCPPQVVSAFRYSAARKNITAVAQQVVDAAARQQEVGKTILVVDQFGNEPRHERARATWKPDVGVYRNEWGRDATHIGDPRPLPYLRDLLRFGLKESTGDFDLIAWTNDDVQLVSCALERLHAHVLRWDFCCTRRLEGDYTHVGRELFAFRSGWLRLNIDRLPDSILGASDWDLHWAAWLRHERGIVTTGQNLAWDFAPVELPAGLAIHEPHASSWNTAERLNAPSTQHNRRLFREWARKHAPTLRFSHENIMLTQ